MTELNGFKIEKFNQYNFSEGVKYSTCPLCSESRKKKTEKCVQLFWETGMAKCNHCGEILQLHTYKKKEQNKPYVKPKFKNNTQLSDKLVKWFEGRKISQQTLKIMKITEGKEWMPQTQKEENTIQFNYFRDNELINIKYRDGKKNFKLYKDAEKIFYNIDSIRTSKEAIIVEGEPDCLTFIEAGMFETVSTPNGSTLKGSNLDYLDNDIEYFENKDKIFLGLDNDEPGRNITNELIRRLGSEKCFIIDYEDCKDANEYAVKYGFERLRQAKENSKPVPLFNVKTYNDYKSDLVDYYKNGSQKGYTIGLEPFDNVFSTYLKQFIVITGVPTHGKSDFVDQMVLGYGLNYDWRGAFCSVENNPKHIHIDKLCRKLLGYRPKNHIELETDTWIEGANWINEHIYFIDFEDGFDLKKVLSKIKELVKRKGIKWFVLDPFNKIRFKESLNKSINDYTNDYLNEIDTFCRQYDLLGLIVAHPTKMLKVNGIITEPGFYDIKGGGEWFDMSPHGLLVYRDFVKDAVKIKVLKCKFQNLGLNDSEVYFKWNTVNGRYTECLQGITDEVFSCTYNYDNWLRPKILEPELIQKSLFQYNDFDYEFEEKNEMPF